MNTAENIVNFPSASARKQAVTSVQIMMLREEYERTMEEVGGPTAVVHVAIAALGEFLSGREIKRCPKTAAMIEAFAQRLK